MRYLPALLLVLACSNAPSVPAPDAAPDAAPDDTGAAPDTADAAGDTGTATSDADASEWDAGPCGPCGALQECNHTTRACEWRDAGPDTSPDASDVPRSCPDGYNNCDGRCVSLPNDRLNCGACGVVCPFGPSSAAACAEGRCGLTCWPEARDCDGNAVNGCETFTRTSAANCGACGRACPVGQVCSGSTCRTECSLTERPCGRECCPETYDCDRVALRCVRSP